MMNLGIVEGYVLEYID